MFDIKLIYYVRQLKEIIKKEKPAHAVVARKSEGLTRQLSPSKRQKANLKKRKPKQI